MNAFEQFADQPRRSRMLCRTVICLDSSYSQEDADIGGRRCDASLAATLRLCEIKAGQFPQDEVAIVDFAGSARLLYPLQPVMPDLLDVNAALKKYRLRSATNMSAGLNLAGQQFGLSSETTMPSMPNGLTGTLRRFLFDEPQAQRPVSYQPPSASHARNDAIVFLTDGCHNRGPAPEPVAQRLKANGIWIATIGVGLNKEFDEEVLKRMASVDESGRPCYRHILDTEQMIRQFEQFASTIRPMREGSQ